MKILNISNLHIYSHPFTSRKNVTSPIAFKSDSFERTTSKEYVKKEAINELMTYLENADILVEHEERDTENLSLLSNHTFTLNFSPKLRENKEFSEKYFLALHSCRTKNNGISTIDEKKLALILSLPMSFWQADQHNLEWLLKNDITAISKKVEEQRQKITKHKNLPLPPNEINEIIDRNYPYLLMLASILDKKTLDTMFKKEFQSGAQGLFRHEDCIPNFSHKELSLLKSLTELDNLDGKAYQYISLLRNYTAANLSTSPLKWSVANQNININELTKPLIRAMRPTLNKEEIENLTDEKTLEKLRNRDLLDLTTITNYKKDKNLYSRITALLSLPDETYEKYLIKDLLLPFQSHTYIKLLDAYAKPDSSTLKIDLPTFDTFLSLPEAIFKKHPPEWYIENNLIPDAKIVINQKAKILKHPTLYLNDNLGNDANAKKILNISFNKYITEIAILSSFLKKEALDNLFRTRLNDAIDYLYTTAGFTAEDYITLKLLSKHAKQPNKAHEYIYLIQAFKDNKINLSMIQKLITSKGFDIPELQTILFKKTLENIGFTKTEISKLPPNKTVWNSDYTHLLSKSVATWGYAILKDIVKATILEPDFMAYLHSPTNHYGRTNTITKADFEKNNLNYEQWINSKQHPTLNFTYSNQSKNNLEKIAGEITENMNSLLKGSLKGILKKKIPEFIVDDDFVIPAKFLTNELQLKKLLNLLTDTSQNGPLSESVWSLAEKNKTNPKYMHRATKTLSVLENLKENQKLLSKNTEKETDKPLNWTIKMWNRIPQKDLFQGNYSTCCIGLGQENEIAMPHYIANTAFNMIELVDNNTNKTIGNALCYFALQDKKPIFIIDNIEINNACKPSDTVGLKVRDKITEYAKLITKNITGNEDTPIYMGGIANDVPQSDLLTEKIKVTLVGKTDCETIYLDAYNGWVTQENLTKEIEILRLI